MSEKLTHQDQLVDYNQRICNKILSSREVMALIANDPDLDLDSPEAAQWEDHIIDHAWVDDTVQESGAFVDRGCGRDGHVLRHHQGYCGFYVEVLVSKTYMALTPSLFKGVKGNRRDNIVRQIDKLLNGSYDFGIGRLDATNIRTVTTANKFSGKLITYMVSDFARNRSLLP